MPFGPPEMTGLGIGAVWLALQIPRPLGRLPGVSSSLHTRQAFFISGEMVSVTRRNRRGTTASRVKQYNSFDIRVRATT